MDVEHICSLAHARAKFKDAERCGSEEATDILLNIGKLYGLEDRYRRNHLTAEEIFKERNGDETNGLVQSIQLKMLELLARPEEEMSDKMRGALNYLHTFWKQIFAYRHDGEYTIDNLAAERSDR